MNNNQTRAEELYQRVVAGGADAIRDLIYDRTSEDLYLDFKRSADDGCGDKLHQNDRKNLAKAISGFGNSEGGIVVWGIDCSRGSSEGDVASVEFPIQDPKRFVSLLNGAVSGVTVPAHPSVENFAVLASCPNKGFVATLVRKSPYAPHQTVKELRYYMRAGSAFSPVPHAVLAGMFGRRPAPNLVRNWFYAPLTISHKKFMFNVSLMVRNDGPGTAKELYESIDFMSKPGPNCEITFEDATSDWICSVTMGAFMSMHLRPGILVPPGAKKIPISIHIDLAPPFERDLLIERVSGCDGCEPARMSIEIPCSRIDAVYSRSQQRIGKERMPERESKQLMDELLGNS